MKAYIDRVLVKENELTLHFLKAFLTIYAEIENMTDELEKISSLPITIDNTLFMYPITFKFDVLIQLGLAFKNKYYYKEAYDYLLPYPFYLEKIECLIGLRKSNEAADEINKFIRLIKDSVDREDRLILCDLNIKLAHLYQNTEYFDEAYRVFNSAKPLYLKGLYYFKNKDYISSIPAFEGALRLTPKDEKIRFSYACALMEVDKISQATDIFKE